MSSRPELKKLLTVPEVLTGTERFHVAGNEYVSLPEIDFGGGIRSINILHFHQKGLLEFCGEKQATLLSPMLETDGEAVALAGNLSWRYELDWLPSFTINLKSGLRLDGEIITPPGFKGFYYRLFVKNEGRQPVRAKIGWQGCWESFNYIVFNRRPVEGRRRIYFDRWTGNLILEALAGLPVAALAVAAEPETEWHYDEKNGRFSTLKDLRLKSGESCETVLYAAVNLEADGAGTTAVDLRRWGQAALKNSAVHWLKSRRLDGVAGGLDELLNRNLFFCYFYALGRSLDGEELVPVTSRSPRYYVSAAFWSRDALLWSFPAIMMADQITARELLLSVFQRHVKNAGDHAHYINGTILYPGFELDQLAAYFLALKHYLAESGDYGLLEERSVNNGLDILTEKALDRFDPQAGLYSTFLDPSDDPVSFPFLTYNNVLLQRAFCFLAELQAGERWHHRSDFAVLAAELQQAIYEHCTVKGPLGLMFAWSVDGKGKFSLYDNPPGSLQLLAHYGFCSLKDTVFKNTVHWIRSANNKYYHQGGNYEEAGSQHAGNPWPLGACNDLLACNAGAEDFFSRAEMDNGFFCETVDPETGRMSTGAAFASAAGFLAYALKNRKPGAGCRTDNQAQ